MTDVDYDYGEDETICPACIIKRLQEHHEKCLEETSEEIADQASKNAALQEQLKTAEAKVYVFEGRWGVADRLIANLPDVKALIDAIEKDRRPLCPSCDDHDSICVVCNNQAVSIAIAALKGDS